jgi:hypothetical protein
VQMRAECHAGRSDLPNRIALLDALASLDRHTGHMSIQRIQRSSVRGGPVVFDHDEIAVKVVLRAKLHLSITSRVDDPTVCHRHNDRTWRVLNIDTVMRLQPAVAGDPIRIITGRIIPDRIGRIARKWAIQPVVITALACDLERQRGNFRRGGGWSYRFNLHRGSARRISRKNQRRWRG